MAESRDPAAQDNGILARIGRRSDVVVGVLLILIALATIVESRSFPTTAVATDIGAGAFPTAFAGILIVLCVLLIFNHFSHGALPDATDPIGTEESEALAEPTGPINYLNPVLGVLLTVAYVAAISWAGYLVTTPIFMFVLMQVLGFRRVVPGLVIALGVTFGLYLIFDVGMSVALPTGTLFD